MSGICQGRKSSNDILRWRRAWSIILDIEVEGLNTREAHVKTQHLVRRKLAEDMAPSTVAYLPQNQPDLAVFGCDNYAP